MADDNFLRTVLKDQVGWLFDVFVLKDQVGKNWVIDLFILKEQVELLIDRFYLLSRPRWEGLTDWFIYSQGPGGGIDWLICYHSGSEEGGDVIDLFICSQRNRLEGLIDWYIFFPND